MFEFFTPEAMTAFLQVIMIDLVLAGDNAIVIGLVAAGLPKEQRAKAILIGIIAATVMRIGFAVATTQLLQIVGLLLAGGLLLLWVCWKMWQELRQMSAGQAQDAHASADTDKDGATEGAAPRKSLARAAWQIIIADVSMSLDNVLAVAGAARDHPGVLVFGLVLSIVLMGLAASFIARLLQKHLWIAYLGLLVILYVAGEMIYRGGLEILPYIMGA
ncbi:TerC family protein [Aquamicrobium segne]|uniref:TerC family protein n=1 Tax=Aquamicrobium segne TaxID=469547 RepID=A0ABW0H3D0_9HYPH